MERRCKIGTQELLNVHKMGPEEYRMGKTKVLIRNPTTVSIKFLMNILDLNFLVVYFEEEEKNVCHEL